MKSRFPALADPLAAPPDGSRALAVGFSGGLDSTSLLHAIAQCEPRIPLRAIHVCHDLQPEAERWATQCRQQCVDWGIAYTQLDVSVDVAGRGIEAAAREARYRAIAHTLTPGEVLVTAHHLQDQAETFLIQALRGSGTSGLAAMPAEGKLGLCRHWRPWLSVSRDTIRDYAGHHALAWVDDPSNHDPNVARSFIRTQVLPLIETCWPSAALTLSRAAAHAQEASEAIETLASLDLERAREPSGALHCGLLGDLSHVRRKQVVRRWLAEAGRDTPDHRHLEQIVGLLSARQASSPCVHFANTDVRLFDGRLYGMAALSPEPEVGPFAWDDHGTLTLPNDCGTLARKNVPAAAVRLSVVFRAGGERLLWADGSHRRLKDVLREAGVPPWVRERMPLIYLGDELAIVPGVWRHPAIDRLGGADIGPVIWRHRLIDGTLRVVRA